MIYDLDVERVDSVQAGPQSLELVAHCFAYADDYDEAKAAAESLADGSLLCGLAFDAGMREAERDRAQRCFVIQLSNERAALAAERERCAKVESELRAALGKREDEWTAMHDAVRRCFWEGLSRDGRLIPSEQLTKRLIEARDLLHKIDGAPAPREG